MRAEGRRKGVPPSLLQGVLSRREGGTPFRLAAGGYSVAQRFGEAFGDRGEGFDHFLGGFHERGAIADQAVAAAGFRVVDGAGDGEDFAAGVGGEASRDQRAGAVGGLDHEGAEGQAGDDAVAAGELALVDAGTGRVFAGDGAGGGDAFVEGGVAAGVGDVDAGAEHGDGAAAGGERAFVGGGVDAGGQAADHREAGGGEGAGEFEGGVAAARGGDPAADDGDARVPQHAQVAGDVQDAWRVWRAPQQRGVVGIVQGEAHRASVGRKRRRRPRAPSHAGVGNLPRPG